MAVGGFSQISAVSSCISVDYHGNLSPRIPRSADQQGKQQCPRAREGAEGCAGVRPRARTYIRACEGFVGCRFQVSGLVGRTLVHIVIDFFIIIVFYAPTLRFACVGLPALRACCLFEAGRPRAAALALRGGPHIAAIALCGRPHIAASPYVGLIALRACCPFGTAQGTILVYAGFSSVHSSLRSSLHIMFSYVTLPKKFHSGSYFLHAKKVGKSTLFSYILIYKQTIKNQHTGYQCIKYVKKCECWLFGIPNHRMWRCNIG